MKKDCNYVRKRLSRYLSGSLFMLQRSRIERHLSVCPVCRSEFDAIKRIDETRRILRDITPPEGLAGPLRAGAASIGVLRRLLYRPLWLLLIVAAVVSVYVYVIHPLLHDPDLERLDAPVPPVAAPAATSSQSAQPTAPAAEQKKAPVPASAAPAPAPLVITITMEKENERSGIRRINESMKEHPVLRTMRFNDSVRELSGSLTAGELYTFFNRIDGAGKVSYKRSRLATAGERELVPFVIRLQTVSAPPRPAEQPGEKPVEKAAEKPVEKPAETQPAQTDNGFPKPTSEGQ